jgi:hypothetical protein
MRFSIVTLLLFSFVWGQATKLVEVKILDHEYIVVHFKDGEVIRRDDGTGNCAYMGHCHAPDGSRAVYYGEALDAIYAVKPQSWSLTSEGGEEIIPSDVYRKTKLNGMTLKKWDDSIKPSGDWIYDITREHYVYLKLPVAMKQGESYKLNVKADMNADIRMHAFTFDVYNNRSEAIHTNIWGYNSSSGIKAADLYHWMGDGGARDYSDMEGKSVYLYNLKTNEKHRVGEVDYGRSEDEELKLYNFTNSDVWHVDFTGFHTPGKYRLVVEGVGCSQDFEISSDIYKTPFRVSTLGFFYMRLGQNTPEIHPRPREPLFIPELDGTEVYISNLDPYDPEWGAIKERVVDPWDHPEEYEPYNTGRTNNKAWGGHSDAYDWDKRLSHVSIIYDMLLPYILTKGALADDNTGIAESGNGIPDILDEARYEVDAWLRLRDGMGYAHGLTCPYDEVNKVRFQGGNTAIAAWANALNSAMLAESFRICGMTELMSQYTDSSLVAFNYANNLDDPMLDLSSSDGFGQIRGRDFKMMAAAYLYNLTGDEYYEKIMKKESVVKDTTSNIVDANSHNQLYGAVAYLFSNRKINYPELYKNLKKSIIHEAKQFEVAYMDERPSRRSTANETGYFHTSQNVQRTMVAHAISDSSADRSLFRNALILEADWSLGRNPANIIQMTTASTPMEEKRSVEAAYTSGYNDGTPGLHPGHTPYWNMNNWAPDRIMGRPGWLASHGYPEQDKWPVGELFFPTDYVWAHTEFTPQQTMRGKQALYGYLYGITQNHQK